MDENKKTKKKYEVSIIDIGKEDKGFRIVLDLSKIELKKFITFLKLKYEGGD